MSHTRSTRSNRTPAPNEPASPPRGLTRAAVLVLAAASFVLAAALTASAGGLYLLAVLLSDGLLALVYIASAALLGHCLLALARIVLPRSLALATSAALGLGLLSLAVLLLGLAGWLSRPSAIALLGAGPVLALARELLLHGRGVAGRANAQFESAKAWLRQRPASLLPWLLIAASVGAAIVLASLPPGFLWPDDPFPYDVLEYHLQLPREWYEAGRITPPHHNVYGFFPFNLEMHYLLAMHLVAGPWKAMYLAQYLTLGYMALAFLAVHGIVRATTEDPFKAALAAAAMSVLPWIIMLGTVAYNEAALILYGVLAVGGCLLSHHRPSREALRLLALAGLMAGFACGAKYTAVPMLLLLVPVAHLLSRFAWRRSALDEAEPLAPALTGAVLFIAAGLLVFSPWLIRNLVWTGNPVFPEAMPLLGPGHFSPQQVDRWEKAHAAPPADRPWTRRATLFAQRVLIDWRYGYLLWPAALAGAWLVGLGRQTRFLLLLLAGMALFWLAFTHLQSRFFVLAVPIAAILLARAAHGALRHALTAAVLLLAILGWAGLFQASARGLAPFRSGAVPFGLEDVSLFLGPTWEQIRSEERLALVGEAQAFLYPFPMSRLRYRTVFDLNIAPSQSPLDAWLGPDAPSLRQRWSILIHPSEIRRFHEHYAHVPLPPEWAAADAPILIRPQAPPSPRSAETNQP